MIKKILWMYSICISSFVFGQDLCTVGYTSLCFTSSHNTMCQEGNKTIIDITKKENLEERIFFIQDTIRTVIEDNTTQNIVLFAEGFDATLLFIAQHNLLPVYRKEIKGVILQRPLGNLYQRCTSQKKVEDNSTCHIIEKWHTSLQGKASKEELFKALSPVLQMDWYESKIVLIDVDTEEKRVWEQAFKENHVKYLFIPKGMKCTLERCVPLKKSAKVQPQKNVFQKPNYFGSILTFHFGKILYHPKKRVGYEYNIPYGSDTLQRYDRYYDHNLSIQRPLFIYVHGGGWQGGDKEYFTALCQRYVDKGYVAISMNYRLLDLPRITMDMMVNDIGLGIEDILSKSKLYHFDSHNITVMGDSSGAQLLFMAMARLSSPTAIQKAIFNSMPTNLLLYNRKKRERLSGTKEIVTQEKILKNLSPRFHLMDYQTQTLVVQVLDDTVVKAKHLATLEVQSVINYNNIRSLWVEHGLHPTSPNERSLQPNYSDISVLVERFLDAK